MNRSLVGITKQILFAAFALTTAIAWLAIWQGPAQAGSDNSNDTYAGDVNWLAVPTGTAILQEYISDIRSRQYVTTTNNIFAKLTGGQQNIQSTLNLDEYTTRMSYYSSLFGHPLVFEAAMTDNYIHTVNVGNLSASVGGLGPQTFTNSGWTDSEVGVGLGVIADKQHERFLAFTNYFYLPTAAYFNSNQFNLATAHQTTWVPQLAYAEGLGKLSPVLNNWWIDLIGNVSVHSNGTSPLSLAPGVQFDVLTQTNSYDFKGFIRYDYMQLGHIAFGIERSWGGDQVASGGVLETIFGGPTSMGTDNFTRGHVQFAVPLPYDFQIAADLSQDFFRAGGFKEDTVAELRLTKLFVPPRGCVA